MCEGCYSDVTDEHGDQGDAIYISDLGRLLAEEPDPAH